MNAVYLSDIPRAVTALAEWCACLVYVSGHTRRLHGPRLWGVLGAGLAVQCLFLTLTDGLRLLFWLPCMAAAVG